jgi:protein-S-isoprenylcysteine O-methyltransferase Ste14
MRRCVPKVLSVIGYLVMAVSAVVLFERRDLFSTSPVVISVQIAAILLLLWARIAFGRRSFHFAADPTEGGLVTGGPYRYIRHPIYAAFCLFVWAGVVAHWSWGAGLYGTLALGGAVTRVHCEEALIVARYPEYAQYAAKTWRMIPYVF